MAAVSLSTLRTRVRERADMVGSLFVSDAECTRYVNASLDELYDIILDAHAGDYFVSGPTTLTLSGSTYPLPATFYRLLGIDATLGGERVDIRKFNFKERNLYRAASATGEGPYYYRLEGSNLRLWPTPSASLVVEIWHAPVRTQLSADGDEVNFPNGWEEYAVIDSAIKCLAKEESDVSVLLALKAEFKERILRMAPQRDSDEPDRVVDLDAPYIGSNPRFFGGW